MIAGSGSAGGADYQLRRATSGSSSARLFLGAALVAMIGLFIGASLKRQLGAVILVLGWLFFLEPALGALFPGTKDYLVGLQSAACSGAAGRHPVVRPLVAVLAAYLVVLGAVAVVLTRRRDIT